MLCLPRMGDDPSHDALQFFELVRLGEVQASVSPNTVRRVAQRRSRPQRPAIDYSTPRRQGASNRGEPLSTCAAGTSTSYHTESHAPRRNNGIRKSGQAPAPMTASQSRAINAIAKRLDIDPAAECLEILGLDLARLNIRLHRPPQGPFPGLHAGPEPARRAEESRGQIGQTMVNLQNSVTFDETRAYRAPPCGQIPDIV